MQKLNCSQRGLGLVAFNQNLEFIKAEIQKGQTATHIHSILQQNGKIGIKINLFRRYVRRLKAEMSAEAGAAVQHSNAESQPKLQTAPQTAPVLRTLSAGSASPKKPKDAPLFSPRPINIADEFADDDSAAVVTSEESEVAHG